MIPLGGEVETNGTLFLFQMTLYPRDFHDEILHILHYLLHPAGVHY